MFDRFVNKILANKLLDNNHVKCMLILAQFRHTKLGYSKY